MKLKTKITKDSTTKESVKEEVLELHLDYIGNNGNVYRYDDDKKRYYDTGISVRGPQGVPGPRGLKGDDGLSAYQLAKTRGFEGTVEEWLKSLKGSSNGNSGGTFTLVDTIKETDKAWILNPGGKYRLLDPINIEEFNIWIQDENNQDSFVVVFTTGNDIMEGFIGIPFTSDSRKYDVAWEESFTGFKKNSSYYVEGINTGTDWVIKVTKLKYV